MTFSSLSTCFFGALKVFPTSVNNLFRGIRFSDEYEIHERIPESLLLGRRTKENLARCFHSFLQVFKMGVLQEIPYFDKKGGPIKAGYITEPNLTYRR